MTNNVLPDILNSYDQLKVKHEPLSLIPPNFETPLAPLQPAVFPPEFRDLPGPPLDLYDLDECFSSEKVRRAQITNKCNDNDLEYYVRECGDILGISSKLSKENCDAKHILEHVLVQIVEFKKAILDHNADDMHA
jgi:intraflagellar transport protein 52